MYIHRCSTELLARQINFYDNFHRIASHSHIDIFRSVYTKYSLIAAAKGS